MNGKKLLRALPVVLLVTLLILMPLAGLPAVSAEEPPPP